MTEPTVPPYVFVIDTDSYAGNFERELCAAITGQTGEGGVGHEAANAFVEQYPADAVEFEKIIMSVADDHGCRRPATTWPTPGYFNDGMGNEYTDETDPQFVSDRYIAEVKSYYNKSIAKCQEHVADGKIEYLPQIEGYRRSMADAEKRGPGRSPSYQSVGIYFHTRPTDEQIVKLKERAVEHSRREGASRWDKPFQIHGFRLVHNEIAQSEESV